MVILIMGVSGSGKTTVGRMVARVLKVPFVDADDLHPRKNVTKMKQGVPLTDADRSPWLKRVAAEIGRLAEEGGGVVACSALKEDYRGMLMGDRSSQVNLVYLKGERKRLLKRLSERRNHFMPPELLDSQLETLEEPDSALTLSIERSPEVLCEKIVRRAARSSRDRSDR